MMFFIMLKILYHKEFLLFYKGNTIVQHKGSRTNLVWNTTTQQINDMHYAKK